MYTSHIKDIKIVLSNLYLDTDKDFYSKPESCGGSIPLSYSSPNATFSTPHYFQNISNNLYIDCWWYITAPYGEEVHLSLLDMETQSEQLLIYDYTSYTTSSSYLVSHLLWTIGIHCQCIVVSRRTSRIPR